MLDHFILAQGLTGLWNTILSNWITPLYIAAVAIFAIVFIKDRAWMKLISFVGIAAIVGVLVLAGQAIFGNPDSGLTGVAKKQADQINTIVVPGHALSGASLGSTTNGASLG